MMTKYQGFDNGLLDILDARVDGERGVQRYHIIQPFGNRVFASVHHFTDPGCGGERVASRGLIDGHQRRGFAIVAANHGCNSLPPIPLGRHLSSAECLRLLFARTMMSPNSSAEGSRPGARTV